MILGSIALSFTFSALGLALSYQLDWPPGSTIALLAALVYFTSLIGMNSPLRSTLRNLKNKKNNIHKIHE
jgi:ABC-type Mn2+/Zn2+ transport system permease subunit